MEKISGRKIKHLDLFSGIGGFALATEMVWPDVEHAFVEKDPFCTAILRKHWPHSPIHDDIKTFEPGPADLITGGFPCQPFSTAGKRHGTQDDRYLWPEMLRVIRASAPRWVIAENVGGLLTWNGGLVLEGVLTSLEAAGYEAWPFVIPACGKNAPHRRDRVWIIAHAIGSDAGRAPGPDARASSAQGLRQRDSVEQPSEPNSLRLSTNSTGIGRKERRAKRSAIRLQAIEGAPPNRRREGLEYGNFSQWNNWPASVARLCAMDDGLPGGLARPRGWRNAALKGAGNAIVPQVAAEIMRAMVF